MSDHFYDMFERADNEVLCRKELDSVLDNGFFEEPHENIISFPDWEKEYEEKFLKNSQKPIDISEAI